MGVGIVVDDKSKRIGLIDLRLGFQWKIHKSLVQYCKTLICFVYDPKGRISNPKGLERDLAKKTKESSTKSLIFPQ
jgi:hypothetical protein